MYLSVTGTGDEGDVEAVLPKADHGIFWVTSN